MNKKKGQTKEKAFIETKVTTGKLKDVGVIANGDAVGHVMKMDSDNPQKTIYMTYKPAPTVGGIPKTVKIHRSKEKAIARIARKNPQISRKFTKLLR